MQPNDGLFKTGLLVCWMAIAGLAVTYPAGAQTTDPAPAPGASKLKPIVIRTSRSAIDHRELAECVIPLGRFTVAESDAPLPFFQFHIRDSSQHP